MKLTVYYDGQFWVGVFEETNTEKMRACRWVFGAEPKDEEILELVKHRMLRLIQRSSQFVEVEESLERRINPKRIARMAAKELSQTGVSTKAQQALQLERESQKKEKQMISREQKEEFKERKWELRRVKAKEKHRGH